MDEKVPDSTVLGGRPPQHHHAQHMAIWLDPYTHIPVLAHSRKSCRAASARPCPMASSCSLSRPTCTSASDASSWLGSVPGVRTNKTGVQAPPCPLLPVLPSAAATSCPGGVLGLALCCSSSWRMLRGGGCRLGSRSSWHTSWLAAPGRLCTQSSSRCSKQPKEQAQKRAQACMSVSSWQLPGNMQCPTINSQSLRLTTSPAYVHPSTCAFCALCP